MSTRPNNQKPKRRYWTDEEIAHIQHLSRMGVTEAAIAEQFNTSQPQVNKLKRRALKPSG